MILPAICTCFIFKARLKGFDVCSTFCSTKLSKAPKKVESLSNGSRIKFEFDQTFARLPYDFFSALKKIGSCRNRLNNSCNFWSSFARLAGVAGGFVGERASERASGEDEGFLLPPTHSPRGISWNSRSRTRSPTKPPATQAIARYSFNKRISKVKTV